jgi:DNA-binding transcriptional MerR regulator
VETSGNAAEAPMTASRSGKSQAAFRTISEVADELEVAQHVLRFWESKFPQVRPLKRGGGRRYYRPEDIELLRDIRSLLYDEGYTIKGAQKLLRQRRARPPAPVKTSAVAVQQRLDGAAPVEAAPAHPAAPDGAGASDPPAIAESSDAPAAEQPELQRLRHLRQTLAELRRELQSLIEVADG